MENTSGCRAVWSLELKIKEGRTHHHRLLLFWSEALAWRCWQGCSYIPGSGWKSTCKAQSAAGPASGWVFSPRPPPLPPPLVSAGKVGTQEVDSVYFPHSPHVWWAKSNKRKTHSGEKRSRGVCLFFIGKTHWHSLERLLSLFLQELLSWTTN